MDNKQEKKLFREKSLERISSPEELNDYVRVANPGVWLLLSGIVILLAGFIVWGIFGSVETTVPGVCVTEKGISTCYVSEEDAARIKQGMKITIEDGSECEANYISARSIEAEDVLSEYAMHIGGFEAQQWVHAIEVAGNAVEGTYAAKITLEALHPIKFIFS